MTEGSSQAYGHCMPVHVGPSSPPQDVLPLLAALGQLDESQLREQVRSALAPCVRVSRPQRRALRARAEVELGRIAARPGKGAPASESRGVWTREEYQRIRACVQDSSGRAAVCVLFMLGSREAAALACELPDLREPRARRRVALAYALARAPGHDVLGSRVKVGLALGLFERVLADANNSRLVQRRRYQPTRRTLSADLEALVRWRVLTRWQVRAEHADPREMKTGAAYPTNRYWAPITRTPEAMQTLAAVLGAELPNERPSPSWSVEDAQALAELRHTLESAHQTGPPS